MKDFSILFWLLMSLASVAVAQTDRAQLAAELARADSLAAAHDYAAALTTGHTIHDQARELYGELDTLTIRIQYRLGTYHFDSQSLDSAEYHTRRALALSDSLPISPTELGAEIRNFLGVMQRSRGNAADAVTTFETVLAQYEQLGLSESEAAARTMNNLAATYDNIGQLETSVRMHQAARPLLIKHLGESHPAVATSLANLGQTYHKLGQTAKAEKYIRESIALLRTTLPDDSPRLAGTMGNLGYLLILRGRYDEAAAILREAMAMIDQSPDGNPRAERSLYTQYSYALTRTGRYDSAAVYSRRAYDAAVELGGKGSSHEAGAATNLAQALEELGEFAEADSLWGVSESFHEQSAPVDSQALLLTRYRRLHYLNRRPGSEVTDKIADVTELIDAFYGAHHHPVAAAAKEAVAEVAINRGLYAIAVKAAWEAFQTNYALVTEDARYLNERDALDAAQDMTRARDLLLAGLLAENDRATIPDSLAERLFAVKGMITEILAERQQEAARDTGEHDVVQAAYRAARREIAGRFTTTRDFGSAAYFTQMNALQRTADSLESLIAAHAGQTTVPIDRSLAPVRETLDASGVLFIDYLIINRPLTARVGESQPWLVASIWQRCGEVQCLALAPLDEIDTQLETLRRHLLDMASQPGLPSPAEEQEYRRLASLITNQIWTPLTAHWCETPGSVHISPDGALSMLPFGALPAEDGRYLIDAYNIAYVSAPRHVRQSQISTAPPSLLAIGDPDFSLQEPDAAEVATLRTDDNDCRLDRLDTLGILPLSRFEAETIADSWSTTTGGEARVLLGAEATEAAFREAAPGVSVMHVATHGYYLDPHCNQDRKAISGSIDDQPLIHPLLLSGIFLAGANAEKASDDPANDGILSAYELAALDLHNTELVVLSACESGLGVTIPGEGVAGLRRALQLAGARTVLCSLWPVPDRRTARFMAELYQRPDPSMTERLVNQQRTTINQLRESNQSTHPIGWASFIAVE